MLSSLGNTANEVSGGKIDFLRLACAEVVSLPLAPDPVLLGEAFECLLAYAVHTPVCIDKVHPILAAIATGGAVEKAVGTGKGQVKKGDEIVFHGGLLIRVEVELPVVVFSWFRIFRNSYGNQAHAGIGHKRDSRNEKNQRILRMEHENGMHQQVNEIL